MAETAGKVFISDLQEGSILSSWFMIAESSLKPSQNGSDYLELRLTDSSGDIVMRIWNANASLADELRSGQVIEVSELRVDSYRGKKQFSLDASAVQRHLRARPPADSDMPFLVPVASRDLDSLVRVLRSEIRAVKDPSIRYLLSSMISDDEFMSRFSITPAAVRHHHAYRSGLLEHTVGVVTACRSAAKFYTGVHGDLLIAGAVLHDIGKLEAYDYDKATGAIRISKKGVLTDHIIIGVDMFRRVLDACVARSPKFARTWQSEYTIHLEHMILSHHGQLEWGSPVEPATIEAHVLHIADLMDSRVNKLERYLQSRSIAPGEHIFADDLRANIYVGDFGGSQLEEEAAPDAEPELVSGETPLF